MNDVNVEITVKPETCETCKGSGYVFQTESYPVKLWNGYVSGTCSVKCTKCPDCNNQMRVFYPSASDVYFPKTTWINK